MGPQEEEYRRKATEAELQAGSASDAVAKRIYGEIASKWTSAANEVAKGGY